MVTQPNLLRPKKISVALIKDREGARFDNELGFLVDMLNLTTNVHKSNS